MTKSFTLDDFRAKAEEKYGAFEIPLEDDVTVRLRNPLRLKKEERKALKALFENDEKDEEEVDEFERFASIFRTVAESREQAEALLKALDGDTVLALIIIEDYFEKEQAGKASSSES